MHNSRLHAQYRVYHMREQGYLPVRLHNMYILILFLRSGYCSGPGAIVIIPALIT